MHLTPKGQFSALHKHKSTWKRRARIEKVARLTAAGTYTDEQIAPFCGVNANTVSILRKTPEYHAAMIQVLTGLCSEQDKELRETEEEQKAELNSMVPAALLGLRNALLSSNPTIALKASLEVLDRDGKLGKVSRVNVVHSEKPDTAAIDSTAFDIMALLNTGSGSNPCIAGFTISANNAGNQVKSMSESIDENTLADIEIKGKIQ